LIGKAYLDIETSYSGDITVLGIFRPPSDLIQLTYPNISSETLLESLDGADEIITYWGHRFDMPVISRWLGVNLREAFGSRDLADHCHRHGLYGGLKAVERVLGIERRTDGLNGADAMRLWEEWRRGDHRSLRRLLLYNEDDVVNLYLLEKELRRLDDGLR
jgi:uncharacterized protein YprB with RNaseH-like and TPR domain